MSEKIRVNGPSVLREDLEDDQFFVLQTNGDTFYKVYGPVKKEVAFSAAQQRLEDSYVDQTLFVVQVVGKVSHLTAVLETYTVLTRKIPS